MISIYRSECTAWSPGLKRQQCQASAVRTAKLFACKPDPSTGWSASAGCFHNELTAERDHSRTKSPIWSAMYGLKWIYCNWLCGIDCSAYNELHQGAPWCRLDIKSGRLNGRLVRQNCPRCWCNWVSSTDHQRTKTPILEEAAFSGIIWFCILVIV